MPVFLNLTNTDPFAAWFLVTRDATGDGIRVVRSVLGAMSSSSEERVWAATPNFQSKCRKRLKTSQPYTLDDVRAGYHTPYTLHHTPYTTHPTPFTLHPTLHDIHHTPYTIHHTPSKTLNSTPWTISGQGDGSEEEKHVQGEGLARGCVLVRLAASSSKNLDVSHSAELTGMVSMAQKWMVHRPYGNVKDVQGDGTEEEEQVQWEKARAYLNQVHPQPPKTVARVFGKSTIFKGGVTY